MVTVFLMPSSLPTGQKGYIGNLGDRGGGGFHGIEGMKGMPGEPGTGGPIGKRLDFLPCCSHFINECHSLPVSDCGCCLQDLMVKEGFKATRVRRDGLGSPENQAKMDDQASQDREVHTHTHTKARVCTHNTFALSLCLICSFL